MSFKQTDIKLHIKEHLSMSSKDLALKIGVTEVTASNIVNNKTTPSVATLYKIANALGVSVSALLGEDVAAHQDDNEVCAFVRFRASGGAVHLHADTWTQFWAMVDEIADTHPRPRKQP